MSEAEVVTFNLKAVINKQKTRVLFVEVDNDFVDLLFGFLILPLGIIVQVLDKHYGDKTPHVIGSLNTLYSGLANLCSCPFQSEGYNPRPFNTELTGYVFPNVNMNLAFSMNETSYSLGKAYFAVYEVFTKAKASFIVCDDLRIVPNVKGSIVQTLNKVGVDMADMDGSETRNVTFGLYEVMAFLKGLLISRQPLTDTILGRNVESELESFKSGTPLHQIHEEATANSKKMILKAMLHKSTNTFLFAQAEDDFVSFLFTMLKTPLGMTGLHLGGNTCFNNLDNLYKSIADHVDHGYLKHGYSKDHLMKPESFCNAPLSNAIYFFLAADRSRMYMMKISSLDVEEVEIHIGLEEARNILKAALTSTSAFTDGLITTLSKKQQKPPKQEQY